MATKGFFETFKPEDIVPLAMKKFDMDMARRKLDLMEADHTQKLLEHKIAGEARLNYQKMIADRENQLRGSAEEKIVTEDPELRASSDIVNKLMPKINLEPEDYLNIGIKSGVLDAKTAATQAVELAKKKTESPFAASGGRIYNKTTGQVVSEKPITEPKGVAAQEPYKVGHVQPFETGEGTSVYREYQGKDKEGRAIWVDRPDLGGKSAKPEPKGFDTMDEAVSEANRVLKKTPSDSGLVATAELGPGNKWIPKLVPNITLRIPPTMPTNTPGVGYDKVKKIWFENMPDGTQRTLSSDEVKQKRLEFIEETPVNDIKTMQQSVPSVLQLIKQARDHTEEAKSSLGPAAGRWSQFYSGKVGASNPEFRRLMTDIGLLQTRLMKMHVGARGGVEMMTHFKQYFDAGKDSPENLKAAFDVVEEYAKEVGLPMKEQREGAGMRPTGGGTVTPSVGKKPLSAY